MRGSTLNPYRVLVVSLSLTAVFFLGFIPVDLMAEVNRWKQYHSTKTTTDYYDTNSVVDIGKGQRRVWIRSVHSRSSIDEFLEKEGITPINEELQLVHIDCLERKSAYIEITFYFRDGSKNTNRYGPPKWFFIKPETDTEELYRHICNTEK